MTARVVSVRPDDSVQVAIGRMMEEHVGSVAVCDQSSLVGIFTERDVLRLASEGTAFSEVRVGELLPLHPLPAAHGHGRFRERPHGARVVPDHRRRGTRRHLGGNP